MRFTCGAGSRCETPSTNPNAQGRLAANGWPDFRGTALARAGASTLSGAAAHPRQHHGAGELFVNLCSTRIPPGRSPHELGTHLVRGGRSGTSAPYLQCK
jgi:hypothetical protein